MCVNKDVPNVCHMPMCACVCFDLNHITHTNPAKSSASVSALRRMNVTKMEREKKKDLTVAHWLPHASMRTKEIEFCTAAASAGACCVCCCCFPLFTTFLCVCV